MAGRNIHQAGKALLQKVHACTLCRDLPLGPRPLLQWHPDARILVAGQAPGRKTHERARPFDDVSGDRLRDWLGVDREAFYDPRRFAILPMGFCYPGTGSQGDLPPRPVCAETWRDRMLSGLTALQLTLVIGQYAMDWHLPDRTHKTLTATVADWKAHWPGILPLPHPSPRNNRWLKRNAFFEADILPVLRERVGEILDS